MEVKLKDGSVLEVVSEEGCVSVGLQQKLLARA